MKNQIISKEPITIWIRGYDKRVVEQPYLLRATKVELMGNELYFCLKKELIFKIWLKEEKWRSYKNINEALKDVDIEVIGKDTLNY
ncbi:MAG: hypothetical protein KJ718_02735 [Nanoarchaeota archaeon]|nr:hypothetical protein [Nanoarchaeota archaeon]MBU1051446.1 hypothetical protein [Nanoarchaeota archaeon]MBU1987892.1 hypothetical protein [Nanoarchaeota archaeon]